MANIVQRNLWLKCLYLKSWYWISANILNAFQISFKNFLKSSNINFEILIKNIKVFIDNEELIKEILFFETLK